MGNIKNNEILELMVNDMNYQETIKLQTIIGNISSIFKTFMSLIGDEADSPDLYIKDYIGVADIVIEYTITNIKLATIPKKLSDEPDINFIVKFKHAKEVINMRGSGIDNYLTYDEWEEVRDLFNELIDNHIDILKKLGEAKTKKPVKTKKQHKSNFSLSSLFKKKSDDYDDYDDYDDDDEYYDDDEY